MLAEENANSAKYEFDGFLIDAAGRRVLHAGEQLQLTPKIFDTLLYLVDNARRLIEKDELMQVIWPDTIVEENNLNKNISVLRRVLNEKQGENRYIATIPGRGYKFVAKVTRATEENDPDSEVHENEARLGTDVALSETAAHEPEISEPAVTRPHFPRHYLAILAAIVLACALALGYYFWPRSAPHVNTIAVLPFKPISTTERDEALEMGMADTLISRLGGGPDVIVRPLASVRRYSGLDQDPIAAARELGVETVLEGNLQRVGDDIRVNARLIRASDGSALWSGTYDERFTNILLCRIASAARSLPHSKPG